MVPTRDRDTQQRINTDLSSALLLAWGHVRVFSPWSYNVDAAARDLLAAIGWRAPDPEAMPTGRDLVREYLAPLAAHPAIAPNLTFGARVEAITRASLDKVASDGRSDAPFVVVWRDGAGTGGGVTSWVRRSWATTSPIVEATG